MTHRALLGLRLLVLLAFAAFFFVPLVWLVLAPTKSFDQLITGGPFTFGSFHQLWMAWRALDSFENGAFKVWLGNSLLYSLSATAIVIATALPAGYGLALTRFPGRKILLTLTLVAMVIPPTALVLPIFLEMSALHLIGSVFSVILPFTFFPFGVYLTYLYFSTAVPPALLDAARLDGCGEWQTFLRIALPLAKPAIAFVFFFSFVADWNNFFLPLAMLANSSQYPVQVGLENLGDGGPGAALAVVIEVIPVAIVFALSQRALVRGLVAGALDG